MSIRQQKLDGARFGWLVIGALTLLWLVGLLLWLQSLFTPNSFYHRLAQPMPGALPALGKTLTFTLAVLWTGLLWARRRTRNAPVPLQSPAGLLELEPRQFEKHVALLFKHKGFQVHHRGKSGDHGVDLEIFPPSGRLGVVQCKRYRSTVGESVVRDLYGAMLHENADHAFLVTAGEISSAARTWAANKPITLVDGTQLLKLARELPR